MQNWQIKVDNALESVHTVDGPQFFWESVPGITWEPPLQKAYRQVFSWF